ncbi:MAG: WhiB family transcriptional regulator [Nocardia sp.]|uniref:WhiB family transcriptional regulator n=1 Tax=Nocardia sp. TaxID=1821 RepID=UPI003454D3D6|nr:WhiB family transcriptional regulator [Nocardia sp.]
MRWEDRAACAGFPTECFFVDGRNSDPERQASVRVAVRVCVNCDVRKECARLAQSIAARQGVWGGVDLGGGQRVPPNSLKLLDLVAGVEAAA